MTERVMFTVRFVYYDDPESQFGPWFADVKGLPRFTNIGDQGSTIHKAFESAMEAVELGLEVMLHDGEWPEDWPVEAFRCPLCGAVNDGPCPSCRFHEGMDPHKYAD